MFKNICFITKDDYLSVFSSSKNYRLSKILKISFILMIGVILLLLLQNKLIGSTVIIFTIIIIILSTFVSKTLEYNYRNFKYLQKEIEFGFNNEKCWAKTEDFISEAKWEYYPIWRERGNWLVLQGDGLIPVFLPIDKLKEQNNYSFVKEILNKYSRQFKNAI